MLESVFVDRRRERPRVTASSGRTLFDIRNLDHVPRVARRSDSVESAVFVSPSVVTRC